MSIKIKEKEGKLAVFIPGLGAVGTTFIAGVEAIRRGLGEPIGSYTQMSNIRLGKRTDLKTPLVKDFLGLESLDNIVFAGWDIEDRSVYDNAIRAGVLKRELLDNIKDFLSGIRAMPAVFDKNYVKKLDGPHIKKGKTWMDKAEELIEDIEGFMRENGAKRGVMVWCGSTEVYMQEKEVHQSIDSFEKGLKENSPDIAPSMVYAYAAIKAGISYANGAPNLSADIPALEELAISKNVPICGKDFKTGQTLMKTIIAPGLKIRNLLVRGWFSTNILGNRDGEVLDDPESFKTKEVSKLSVLEQILGYNPYHKVRINYYPPRGDNKEGWDNIDIDGFLGYPMQIKVNFLCRDSILAAPLVLDIALLMDFALRVGMKGIQEWMGFFFKSPHCNRNIQPEHSIFTQHEKLENTLRYIKGEDLINHLGLEYYPEMYNYLKEQREG